MVQAEETTRIEALRWKRPWSVQGTESMSVWILYHEQLRKGI